MTKEITLAKAHEEDGEEIEGVIINITENLPGLFDDINIYDPTTYFKYQASMLIDGLVGNLPHGTLQALVLAIIERLQPTDDFDSNFND
jgi:hypothetical protein